jgi:predicted negative regulator of RcsB-dependent stress response
MKTLLYALLALAVASPLCAQRYILNDGRVLNQADVSLKGSNLVRQVADGAEVSYPLSQIARLDWPEPEEIDQSRQLVAAGKGVEAEEKITPIYRQFAPFSKVPGSWWSEAALIRARALLAQEKKDETERAARELMSTAADPEVVAAAQLIMARIQVMLDKADLADAMLDEIMRKDASSEIEARAAILRGDIAYGRKEFEKALEFYLQVPAFYGTEEAVMPLALLGSARSYRGYGDTPRAERAYLDIIVTYPESAEAAIAKTESAGL